jgi:hypothetical protein
MDLQFGEAQHTKQILGTSRGNILILRNSIIYLLSKQNQMKKLIAIIPKEEPKQETLEEAAENLFNDFQSKNPIVPQKHILPYKLGFIEGAKWKEERMYSEEEVLKILLAKNADLGIIEKTSKVLEFIEQFKKD